MKFKNLNRQYQTLKPAIDQAVREVLGSQDFILGESVRKLEKELAAFTHRRHCITCASGSDALLLSLMALNIGPEDAVFLPDFTYIAAASAIQRTGAIPVFVDIDPVTFNMDPQDLECQIERIRQTTRFRPKAVIPADLFGLPADYGRILPIAARHGLHVVSDAAQSMGASFKGQPAGSFGTLAITSFFPAKPLGCYGDGGAIFTDDDRLAARLCRLRSHGRAAHSKYLHVEAGLNSRLDTLQAAILRCKLQAYAPEEQRALQQAARRYAAGLKGVVQIPAVMPGQISAWAQYTILLYDANQRRQVQQALTRNGIPSMVYYPAGLHEQPLFRDLPRPPQGYPRSEWVSQRCLSLPMDPYIREAEIDLICRVITETILGKDSEREGEDAHDRKPGV